MISYIISFKAVTRYLVLKSKITFQLTNTFISWDTISCRYSKNKYYGNSTSWGLYERWGNKRLFLCMGGLSLDCQCLFKKKLVRLPFLYDTYFKQLLVFQKEISRIVQICGTMRISFHMLHVIICSM